MDPVTVSATIGRPREEVFAYLSDVANLSEFSDHFLSDLHLLREETVGAGAGARFRIDAPCQRFSWGDLTFDEVDEPYRISFRGRMGKYNRIRHRGEWRLHEGTGGTTRLELTFETAPVLPSDRIAELVAGRAWFRAKLGRAVRRLRAILEEDRQRGRRITLAGG